MRLAEDALWLKRAYGVGAADDSDFTLIEGDECQPDDPQRGGQGDEHIGGGGAEMKDREFCWFWPIAAESSAAWPPFKGAGVGREPIFASSYVA